MEDIHRYFGKHGLWEKYLIHKSPTLDVTEIWSHVSSTDIVVEDKSISSLDLENWLGEDTEKLILSENHHRIVRLVWVGENPKTSRSGPSANDLSRILEAWNMQHAFAYGQSCYAGVSELPLYDGFRNFTVTYHPKLAMTWAHRVANDGRRSTQGIIFAGGEQRIEITSTLKSRWSSTLASHAMFPTFICSLVLTGEFDATAGSIKSNVREVEVRTGHHRFSHRQEKPAAGELGHLSAQMSGCAAKLANGTRKLKVVAALHEFILKYLKEDQIPTPTTLYNEYETGDLKSSGSGQSACTSSLYGEDVSGKELLTYYVEQMQHRLQMQFIDNEYVQQRVQVQIAALFHLIAQQDNAIAFETASSTRSIAYSSQQDSSSMKMLALVAMFFLPPSFVAALFSTPVFDWDAAAQSEDMNSIGVSIRPQFKLFWAITLPVTALTFVVYGAGLLSQKRQQRASRQPTTKTQGAVL